MNTEHIEAILFDMGGTLRRSTEMDAVGKRQGISRIMQLIGLEGSEDQFSELLTGRANAYRSWAQQTMIELNESELWTKWMLPDWPADRIGPLAIQLNQAYRDSNSTKDVFPETKEVILSLFRRGYRLGLVSNTTSSVEAPRLFESLRIGGCFETLVLSCQVGMRKPDPAILLEAVKRMGLLPESCVYIGDRPDRDVAAARRAGFASVILLRDPALPEAFYTGQPGLTPDRLINNLNELLDLFAVRPTPPPESAYQVSLSTMWARKNFPGLAEFFLCAKRLGYASVELNHQIDSAMLVEADLHGVQISSVHEPCPADISMEELKKRDWMLSSTNESFRKEGVKSVQRSIKLAQRLGARAVVIHAGSIEVDKTLENHLRRLYETGQAQLVEYQEYKERLIARRRALAPPHFAAVRQSISDLLEYAHSTGVVLGLENRYHYMEFPSPDELEQLFQLAGAERLGFIYDVGHAHTLDRLGLYSHEAWLQRFSSRITGVHLHDVVGLTDHHAPGKGEVDFAMVAAYLPENAFRTCEFQGFNSFEDVKNGLKFLQAQGCIRHQNLEQQNRRPTDAAII